MKKVLFAIKRLDKFGGAERVIVNLANVFASHGYETLLSTFVGDKCIYPISKDVKLHSVSDMGKNENLLYKLKTISRFRKLIKDERPDVIIAFQFDFNMISIVSSFGTGIPVIISERNNPRNVPRKKILRVLRKILYPFAEGAVFQTDEAKHYFSKRIVEKSVVICNPVRQGLPEPEKEVFDGRIITAGRLENQKRHDILIKAFASIKDKFPNSNLYIYGNGSKRNELENLIDKMDLGKRVMLMEAVENLPEVMNGASLFVLSSDFEGMPNVLIEALCMGIPCISTDCPCGGPRELINDGENGFLVPVGNIEALAEKMEQLLSDEDMMKNISHNAGLRRDKYSLENIYEEWKSYAEQISDKK